MLHELHLLLHDGVYACLPSHPLPLPTLHTSCQPARMTIPWNRITFCAPTGCGGAHAIPDVGGLPLLHALRCFGGSMCASRAAWAVSKGR